MSSVEPGDDELRPLRSLRLRSGDLELRTCHESDAFALARLSMLGVHADNESSQNVSRTLGYADDGTRAVDRQGDRTLERRYLLTAETWRARSPEPVTVEGSQAVAECLGFAARLR